MTDLPNAIEAGKAAEALGQAARHVRQALDLLFDLRSMPALTDPNILDIERHLLGVEHDLLCLRQRVMKP